MTDENGVVELMCVDVIEQVFGIVLGGVVGERSGPAKRRDRWDVHGIAGLF